MSCCNPEYRKVVNDEERRINEKGKDTVPFFVKIISLLVVVAGVIGISLYI
jgi:hypothetical protein